MALTKIDDRGLTTPIDLLDNEKIRFGTGNDLELFHDGTNSYIDNSTGNLYIRSGNNSISIRAKDDAQSILCLANAATELYYAGSKKFETYQYGVTVTGNVQVGTHAYWGDNGEAIFGAGSDLKIYHDGTNSWINNATGALYLKTAANNSVYVLDNNNDTIFRAADDGATELYYDNSKKLETTSNGVAITGEATCSAGLFADGDLWMVDQLRHTGDTDTAIRFPAADTITFEAGGGERLRIASNGSVGVNVTNPQAYDPAARALVVGEVDGYGHTGMTIRSNGTDKQGAIYFADGTASASYRGRIEYLHTDDTLRFGTAGGGAKVKVTSGGDLSITDGNLVVASGHGIDFSANANATGNTSNLLDDYESGTWTATVVTGTCSQQSCKYIKIGNQCTVWGRIHGLSDTSTNIILKIEGLPYGCNISSAAGNKFSKDISIDANCVYITTSEQLTFYGHNTANAWSYVTHLSCGGNMEIYFYGTYRTEYPGSN